MQMGAGLLFREEPEVLTLKNEDFVRSFDKGLELVGGLEEDMGGMVKAWLERTSVKTSNAGWSGVRPVTADSAGRGKGPPYRARTEEATSMQEFVGLLKELGYPM